ncbi:MAG: agmatine deiminase family protein [Elusimicrobiota bacterium]
MKNAFKTITAIAMTLLFAASVKAASPFDGAGSLGDPGLIEVPAVSEAVPVAEPSVPEASVPAKGYTAEQLREMRQHNAAVGASANKGLTLDDARVEIKYRPYADYEKTGYLIMSADFNFDSRQAKLTLASKLPADGTLVIFTDTYGTSKEEVLRAYEGVVPRERIKVVALRGASRGFWARDGIPVPAMDASGNLVVVDAVYGHGFEPDAEIGRLFGARVEKHGYYFEGGNFMANHSGTCIMVNAHAHVRIPDSVFAGQYGCREMIRLPLVDGIGHIDEHVRFISEKVVVTDLPQYKDALEGKGLTVHMMPKPSGPFETYVNSVIMDGKVIVPVFGRATDEQALAVYRSLGLEAFGADSRTLSNNGQGSVHCITMTYPKVPARELMKALGATEL